MRVIDATESGVAKRGAEPMPLASAIERFCAAPLPIAMPAGRIEAAPDIRPSLRRRIAEGREIGEICRRTRPLLERIARRVSDQRAVNAAIAQLDALRRAAGRAGRDLSA